MSAEEEIDTSLTSSLSFFSPFYGWAATAAVYGSSSVPDTRIPSGVHAKGGRRRGSPPPKANTKIRPGYIGRETAKKGAAF